MDRHHVNVGDQRLLRTQKNFRGWMNVEVSQGTQEVRVRSALLVPRSERTNRFLHPQSRMRRDDGSMHVQRYVQDDVLVKQNGEWKPEELKDEKEKHAES